MKSISLSIGILAILLLMSTALSSYAIFVAGVGAAIGFIEVLAKKGEAGAIFGVIVNIVLIMFLK